MKTLELVIQTPERLAFQGPVVGLRAKAIDGEVGIMADHAPYANILLPGQLMLEKADLTCVYFPHNGGLLEVSKNKATVLASSIPSQS